MDRTLPRLLATLLAAVLTLPTAVWAQGGARVNVIEGQNAINDASVRTVVRPLVEVVDASGQPVAGVPVEFRSPTTGPTVTFYGATFSTTVTTGEDGRAMAPYMTPNEKFGPYQIEVTAMLSGQPVSAAIEQTNADSDPPQRITGKKKKLGWRTLTALGAAGLTILIVAARGSGN